jgi:Rrf2 family transcriptional regulator, iron-sulfur cluster assembly transcription factor
VRLEVTRKSDLAVRTLRTLAELPPGKRAKGPELAETIGSTPGFVAQVMTPLVRAGWVASEPGPTGGYSLRVDLTAISVLAVIEAIEGPTDTGRCVLADRPCSEEGPCALHTAWQRARQELLRELASMSICDVDTRTWSPTS